IISIINSSIKLIIQDKYINNIHINKTDTIFICQSSPSIMNRNLYVCTNCDNFIGELNCELESNISVLINFSREDKYIIWSINTKTILEKFSFNDILNIVNIPYHQLKEGDI